MKPARARACMSALRAPGSPSGPTGRWQRRARSPAPDGRRTAGSPEAACSHRRGGGGPSPFRRGLTASRWRSWRARCGRREKKRLPFFGGAERRVEGEAVVAVGDDLHVIGPRGGGANSRSPVPPRRAASSERAVRGRGRGAWGTGEEMRCPPVYLIDGECGLPAEARGPRPGFGFSRISCRPDAMGKRGRGSGEAGRIVTASWRARPRCRVRGAASSCLIGVGVYWWAWGQDDPDVRRRAEVPPCGPWRSGPSPSSDIGEATSRPIRDDINNSAPLGRAAVGFGSRPAVEGDEGEPFAVPGRIKPAIAEERGRSCPSKASRSFTCSSVSGSAVGICIR